MRLHEVPGVATRSSVTSTSATPAPTTLLRPVLEAALQIARAGEAADPVVPAPAALRRYLNFARLPAPALDIARRVVEDDDEFRQHVAAKLNEQDVGEAGWLWLTRPDGWKERFEELRKQHQQLEHAAHDEKVERDSQRRLAGAEDRARRAEVALNARAREVEEARAALVEERNLRRQAEGEFTEVNSTIEELRSQRNAAVRQLKDIEAELAQRTADLRHARHEIRMREAELEQATQARVAAQQALVAAHRAAVTPNPGSSAGAGGSGSASAPAATPPATAPAATASAAQAQTNTELIVARAELAHVVAEAAAGAERLSTSLSAAAQLLAATEQPNTPVEARAAAPPAQRSGPRRTPLRLPPGIADDSLDAAEHLLRAPGALLLVDGYNVSHALWWDLPIAGQRDRLVSALAELHARTGAEIEVVFDGAEIERSAQSGPRPAVRVRFSPPGVEADDVIIDLVGAIAVSRPVIVASSDRRVRDGVRRNGANVLGARQLAGALRR
jgi:predicted RNA-binding protein with PIN domain